MSPRRRDPRARSEMVRIAARLLAEGAPLTTRRVTTEAGSSTMAVYTHFGNMSGLVRAIVHEGFARLSRGFDRVDRTDDPVADLALLGRVYRHVAVTNPNLYAVMFGSRSLAGFHLTDEDRQHGRYAMARVVEGTARCVEAGRFRPADPTLAAHHLWLGMHGLVTLENGDYLAEPRTCAETQLVSLMVGAGDTLPAATASVRRSAERFAMQISDTGAVGAGIVSTGG